MSGSGLVLFACEWLPDYRVEFFTSLRTELHDRGLQLSVIYGNSQRALSEGRASARLEWGISRPNHVLPLGKRSLVWQQCARDAIRSDLVVVEQASRLLLNYWLLWHQRRGRSRVAFWGHGENLNQPTASRLGEGVKRRVSRMPHWWFAYTEGTRERVARLGYPADRITVTQNASPTISLRRLLDTLRPEREAEIRRELGLSNAPTGLFMGSLYAEKRLDYLIAAADEIVARRPDFRLVVAGEGPARDSVAAAASCRPHVLWAGRADGERKATLLKNASVMMIPGAVGLAVVDAFVAGVPVATTSVATHGPEMEYVRDGENGRVVPEGGGPAEYAKAVLSIIQNGRHLREGAAQTGGTCTTENMVARFVEGIELALRAKPLRDVR